MDRSILFHDAASCSFQLTPAATIHISNNLHRPAVNKCCSLSTRKYRSIPVTRSQPYISKYWILFPQPLSGNNLISTTLIILD